MKLNFKHILSVFFSVALLNVSFSQKARLKYANKMYDTQSYYFASEGFEDVIDRKVDSLIVAHRLAESYDKIGNTVKAAEWYRYLNRKGQLTDSEKERLSLVERQLGNYDASDALQANIGSGLTPTIPRNDLLANNPNYEVTREHKVNTSSSEMGVSPFENQEMLISSSKRRIMVAKQLQGWTGDYHYDIYRSKLTDEGELGKLKLMKSKTKTRFHDGPAIYHEPTKTLYFTRNNFQDGKRTVGSDDVTHLKIYSAKWNGKKFENEQALSINGDNFSSAHPAISKDGKTLYFSSDRPGGLGGMDIYKVELDQNGNSTGSPVNLGVKVNTPQHDVFPSYLSSENLLYFSSEGHYGLGGLDIYAASLDGSGMPKSIINLGAPVNSNADDFAYYVNETQTNGYFTSNREGGDGSDDIYRFTLKKAMKNTPIVEGQILAASDNDSLANAMVYLKDKNGYLLDSVLTDKNGRYSIDLDGYTQDFIIVAKKDGYSEESRSVKYTANQSVYRENLALNQGGSYFVAGRVTDQMTNQPIPQTKVTVKELSNKGRVFNLVTDNDGRFKTIDLMYHKGDSVCLEVKYEKSPYLLRQLDLDRKLGSESEIIADMKMVKADAGTDLGTAIALNNIYFDFDKSNIRPDAAVELDKIVSILKNNPAIKVDLGSHTDSRGEANYNQALSQRRAKATMDYLVSKGINRNRISGKGYGETRLVVKDSEIEKSNSESEQEAMHQKNRRTEFIVIQLK